MEEKKALAEKRCIPCEGDVSKLGRADIDRLLKQIDGWEESDGRISKEFTFKNFLRTMAFVNAVAWVALRENHHPDLQVGYTRCRVSYTTHAAGGLTENDFICAALVDKLMD